MRHISNWKRYLDDMFFTWTGADIQLMEFCELRNLNDQHLEFPIAAHKMNFLGIIVIREGSTDINSLLHGKSYLFSSRRASLSHSSVILDGSDEDFQE